MMLVSMAGGVALEYRALDIAADFARIKYSQAEPIDFEHEIYQRNASLGRAAGITLCFLGFAVTGRAWLDIVFDNAIGALVLFGPLIVVIILIGLSYRRRILAVAKAEGWQKAKS